MIVCLTRQMGTSMKTKALWTIVFVLTAYPAISVAQDGNSELRSVLKNLQNMRAAAELRSSERGRSTKPEFIPSAHQTREAEELINDIARNAAQLSLLESGGANSK